MKNIKSAWLIPFTLLLLFLSACGGEGGTDAPEDRTKELIAQSWTMTSMTDHGQMAPMQLIVFSSFTFNKNGNYEILMGELEKGKWSLSPDNKVLITVPTGADFQNEMDIEYISEDQLILTNKGNGADIRMVMKPAL